MKKHRRARKFKSSEKMVNTLLNIAENYGRTKGPARIAREEGIPVEKVYGLAANLRKHGVKIPSLPRNTVYHRAIQLIAEKTPDLLDKRTKVYPK